MKIVGQTVVHKILGEGIIIELKNIGTNSYITVNFIREIKEFAFPGIFETRYMYFKSEQTKKDFETQYLTQKTIQPKNVDSVNNNDDLIKEYKSIKQLSVKAIRRAHLTTGLKADLFSCYGSHSGEIYDECCKIFCWDSMQRDNFGRQGAHLFATNATSEGFDVWFLTHSNYTDNMNNECWINKISDNREKIFELWTDRSKNMDIGRDRLIFAKTTNGKYIFLGIYKVLKKLNLEDGSRLRVFKRISETYPL